jgi:hypothetical protein
MFYNDIPIVDGKPTQRPLDKNITMTKFKQLQEQYGGREEDIPKNNPVLSTVIREVKQNELDQIQAVEREAIERNMTGFVNDFRAKNNSKIEEDKLRKLLCIHSYQPIQLYDNKRIVMRYKICKLCGLVLTLKF